MSHLLGRSPSRRLRRRVIGTAVPLALAVLALLSAPACAQAPSAADPSALDWTLPCPEPQPGTEVQRIAFGSCAREERPQPIWHAIADQNPQVFLFLGDNIYADSDDMNVHRADYARLGAVLGFQRLCRQGTAVLATWDDHDYGKNDAGVEWTAKREAQAVFLDWLGVPAGSPRSAAVAARRPAQTSALPCAA
jgi:alkaline phosphatase D